MRRLSPLFVLLLSACASSGGVSGSQDAVTLLLKGKAGTESDTRYSSSSHVLTYTDGQLIRDRNETVDFVVRNKVQRYEPQLGVVQFQSKTISKDGPGSLHDLAFPEMGEVIDYAVKSSGEVLMAGPLPPSSLFFVPSVPIPKEPVQVGDVWVLEHVWRSSRDGVPLRLEVAAILKDIVKCDGGGRCADLEISGHVRLVLPPDSKDARFISKLWGRMLFSLERGDVIWSQTRSFEDISHSKGRVTVNSCMTSEMKIGGGYRTPHGCEPGDVPVLEVPKL
jgi:hypothetical protein